MSNAMESNDVVSANDMCDDIRNFSMKVAEACVTAEKAISTNALDCIGFGFSYAEFTSINNSLIKNKTSGWLNLRVYLLRSAIEKVAGNKYECDVSYQVDPKHYIGTWYISMRKKSMAISAPDNKK